MGFHAGAFGRSAGEPFADPGDQPTKRVGCHHDTIRILDGEDGRSSHVRIPGREGEEGGGRGKGGMGVLARTTRRTPLSPPVPLRRRGRKSTPAALRDAGWTHVVCLTGSADSPTTKAGPPALGWRIELLLAGGAWRCRRGVGGGHTAAEKDERLFPSLPHTHRPQKETHGHPTCG